MTDLLRNATPTGSDVTIEFRPVTHSSRTIAVYGTVVEHTDDAVILGVHPDLLSIPASMIEVVR